MNELAPVCRNLSQPILFIFFILFVSCTSKTKDFDEVALMGYEYYPIETGTYITYQAYYYSAPDTTRTYQIKEVTSDTLRMGDEIVYKLERYERNSELEQWPQFPARVWTVSLNTNKIIKSEDNIRYIKLVFPLSANNSWNGNGFNSDAPLTYRIKELGKGYGGFSETLKVFHGSEDSTLVRKNYRLEVFAKNIGLIYKQYDNFIYDQGVDLGKYKRGIGSTRYIEKFIEKGRL